MVTRKKEKRPAIQGEGDYRSAREFNDKERAFVRSHDTESLADAATPADPAEAAELERAEREGKARARPDPAEEHGGERDKEGGAAETTPPKK
jgi:hypothetical protein